MPVVRFHATERQPLDDAAQLVEVEREVLRPEARTLADRHRLRHLKVRVAKAWLGAPRSRKLTERAQHRYQALLAKAQRIAIHDQVRVVGDKATGGAKMNDRPSRLCQFTKVVHMRHHVVAQFFLQCGTTIPVELIAVRLEVFDLRLCHREAKVTFCLGQRDPEVAPGGVASARREQRRHFLACITFDQRVIKPVAAIRHAVFLIPRGGEHQTCRRVIARAAGLLPPCRATAACGPSSAACDPDVPGIGPVATLNIGLHRVSRLDLTKNRRPQRLSITPNLAGTHS